jgi:hypothetical protein
MLEDEKFDPIAPAPEGENKEFEVEELSEESLEGVAGGVFEESADTGISKEAPGNNCTNSATNC